MDSIQKILSLFTRNGDSDRSVAFCFLDKPDQVLGINEDIDRPAASCTKIADAAVLLREFTDRLEDRVKWQDIGKSSQPALCNVFDTSLKLREVLALGLCASDNMCASYIQDYVGIRRVNDFLQEIGCLGSRVESAYRDSDLIESIYNNRLTCRDSLTLLCHLWNDPAYKHLLRYLNNNLFFSRIASGLDDFSLVCHKTGTLIKEGNLSIVNDIGIVNIIQPFAISFLTENQTDKGSTESDMAVTVRKIVSILEKGSDLPCN